MLQSYEAIYDHGKLKWISDKPAVEEARIIVTLLSSEPSQSVVQRQASPRIAGKGRILDDIVQPAISPADWNVVT